MFIADDAREYLRATGPTHDNVQREMATVAHEEGFPIIGPDAGGVLRFLATVTGARRVFEFGSGFGYSASWFLRGMDDDGEIVLTEIDADELAMAEEFLTTAGWADRATFEHGDCMDVVGNYQGQFDLVLIDHDKARYADAFEAIRSQLPAGGVVVADNMMSGAVDYADLLPYFQSGADLPDDENTRGIARYLDTVRGAEGFFTTVLPVGSGIALTVKE